MVTESAPLFLDESAKATAPRNFGSRSSYELTAAVQERGTSTGPHRQTAQLLRCLPLHQEPLGRPKQLGDLLPIPALTGGAHFHEVWVEQSEDTIWVSSNGRAQECALEIDDTLDFRNHSPTSPGFLRPHRSTS
jgi:hypothetical protein